jgi:nucleoside-diphosphate-sugar epimerase
MKFVVSGGSGLIGSKLVNKLHQLGDAEVVRRFAQTHYEGAFNEIVNSYGDRIFRTASHLY